MFSQRLVQERNIHIDLTELVYRSDSLRMCTELRFDMMEQHYTPQDFMLFFFSRHLMLFPLSPGPRRELLCAFCSRQRRVVEHCRKTTYM